MTTVAEILTSIADPGVRTIGADASTHNARFEDIAAKASFEHSRAYGKGCVIPAQPGKRQERVVMVQAKQP